jgi:hypothetical protein
MKKIAYIGTPKISKILKATNELGLSATLQNDSEHYHRIGECGMMRVGIDLSPVIVGVAT